MRSAVRWGVGVAALLVGALAVHLAPTQEEVTAPIQLHGGIGDRIAGRVMAVTVTDVELSHRLRLTDGTAVESDGVFLLVHLRLTPRLADVALGRSTVVVDGKTFRAYDDPRGADLSAAATGAGLTDEGTLAFELPDSARRAPEAELMLGRGEVVPDQVSVVAFRPDRLRLTHEAVAAPRTAVAVEDP